MWKAKTTRINRDTGEIITEKQSKKLIKIKTKKYVTTNKNKTIGTIEYRAEYTQDGSQLELFDS